MHHLEQALKAQILFHKGFGSRRLGAFASKILNGMRYKFGGHDVR